MKLYTSYYGKQKALDKAGIIPLAISVSIPDWATIDRDRCWYKALAPERSMMKMEWKEYVPKYRDILRAHNPVAVCNMIKKMSGGKDAALLCWEKDAEQCHRSLVAEWLNAKVGTHIEEWEVERADANQKTFFDPDEDGGMSGFIDRACDFIDGNK